MMGRPLAGISKSAVVMAVGGMTLAPVGDRITAKVEEGSKYE